MSLLDQAKAVPVQKKNGVEIVDTEKLELAIAYVKHEVTGKQVSTVVGIKNSSADSEMKRVLASAVRAGMLVRA